MSRTNEERSVASRCNLIEAGRRLFGEHGYAATSTPMIAEAAGASRGALYHHFADKAALFAAVVEAEYERLEAEIERTSRETTDPLEALIEGGESFMTAASDPATQRILFIDGPAVVGIELLHSADSRTTTKSLRAGIEAAQLAGRLPRDIPTDALTSLISGAYDRAVLDGLATDEAGLLAFRHAIRIFWHGLSKVV